MSNPAAPDPSASPAPLEPAPATNPSLELFREPVETGNLPFALGAGAVAALIGAVLWAVVTVTTEYQIGFMAVGVGYLVGKAVGKFGRGSTTPFQVTGAVLALLGCVLGNAFTLVGFFSRQANIGIGEALTTLNYTALPGIMVEAASPMDFLFYAIAVYEGFKFSTKR